VTLLPSFADSQENKYYSCSVEGEAGPEWVRVAFNGGEQATVRSAHVFLVCSPVSALQTGSPLCLILTIACPPKLPCSLTSRSLVPMPSSSSILTSGHTVLAPSGGVGPSFVPGRIVFVYTKGRQHVLVRTCDG
jgi:hypothetical protein